MDTKKIYAQRIAKVLEQIKKYRVDALLIRNNEGSQLANTRYLNEFSGSASLSLVSPDWNVLITDSRYAIQANEQVHSPWQVQILNPGQKSYEPVKNRGFARIGIIGEHITVAEFRTLRSKLKPTKLAIIPDILSPIQEIKDDLDLVYIQQAIKVIEVALQHVITCVKPGVSELQLKRELIMALPPTAELAFEIIASGPRSAMPHGRASKRIIQKGDIVQFDVGCCVDGYNSDISRVMIVGKATDEQKRMHRAVQEALQESMKLYLPGRLVSQAADKANEVLRVHGYQDVPHRLGHGLGLKVHENPGVGPYDKEKFRIGQLVTNEPGIYIEGYGGMRIERDVLITETGQRCLDTLTTDLIEI